MPPETFFPLFDKFIKNYKKAEEDIDTWKIQAEKREAKEKVRRDDEQQRLKEEQARTQMEAMNSEKQALKELRELRRRDRTTIVNQDGAIDENLAYLRSQPYRRADAVQRSFRGRKGKGSQKGVSKSGTTSML